MENKCKPEVVVSRCLGFSHCRYDGQTIPDKFVEKLKDYVVFKTVCPEVEIGLGVPRPAVRLISEDGQILLFQSATGKEFTREMNEYSSNLIKSLGVIDGFILKGRSPSCGIKDVKVYIGKEKPVGSAKGVGIFAAHILQEYTAAAIEEEGRLTNFRIREHFLTKLFTMFRFRQVNSMKELVKFHSDNKYLIMAYSQKGLKNLGSVTANHSKKTFNEVKQEYEFHLALTFEKIPRYTGYINSLMHIFGYFSENLSSKEKDFVLSSLERYREEKLPLSVPVNIMRSYAIKYEKEYLLDQWIWQPYPEGLVDISNSGRSETI